MAMTDEERLQFAVAQELAAYTQERGPVTEYWNDAQSFIAQLRGRGVTLTPPPAPEPTYTIRVKGERQRGTLLFCVNETLTTALSNEASDDLIKTMHELAHLIAMADSDPEPGA